MMRASREENCSVGRELEQNGEEDVTRVEEVETGMTMETVEPEQQQNVKRHKMEERFAEEEQV